MFLTPMYFHRTYCIPTACDTNPGRLCCMPLSFMMDFFSSCCCLWDRCLEYFFCCLFFIWCWSFLFEGSLLLVFFALLPAWVACLDSAFFFGCSLLVFESNHLVQTPFNHAYLCTVQYMFLIDCLPLMVLISKSLRHLFLGVSFFGISIFLACASSGVFITLLDFQCVYQSNPSCHGLLRCSPHGVYKYWRILCQDQSIRLMPVPESPHLSLYQQIQSQRSELDLWLTVLDLS